LRSCRPGAPRRQAPARGAGATSRVERRSPAEAAGQSCRTHSLPSSRHSRSAKSTVAPIWRTRYPSPVTAVTEPDLLPRDDATRGAIDRVLVAQLVVAWAGEGGERPRMDW